MSTPTQATATHALVEVRVHDLESIEPVRGATATLVVRSIPRVQVTWNDGIALFPDIPFTQGGGQYPLEVAAQGYQTDVRSLPVLLPLVSVRVDLAPLATRTPTPTKTLTAAPTELPTPSPSPTATPTHSPTPSITSTATRTPTRTITPTATADLVRGRWTGSAESSDGNSIRTLVLVFSAQNRIDAQLSDVAGSFAFTGSYGIDALSLAAVRLFDSVRQAELSLEGTLTLDLSRIEGTLVLWAGMAEQYTFTVRRAAGQFN